MNFRNAGYTLVELIVVISIASMLVAITIGLSRGSQKNLDLVREQVKISSLISRAKSLALAPSVLEFSPYKLCAYGVKLDYSGGRFFIFEDKINGPQSSCDTDLTAKKYTPDNVYPEEYMESKLDSKFIRFSDSDTNQQINTIQEIVFVPPEPQTILWTSPGTASTSRGFIQLEISGTSQVAKIELNDFGLVSIK